MKITATGHIKTDKTEVRVEVWDADYCGAGAGLAVELTDKLTTRGYIDTNNNITGYRLTIPAAKANEEAKWLLTQGIKMGAGKFYN